ncbi:MAG: nucleotide exchange factor GrpE [Dehalococcoidia bacterium]
MPACAPRESCWRRFETHRGGVNRYSGGCAAGPEAPETVDSRAAALESWLQGLLLIERRLLALLEGEGVRPIATLGRSFDPDQHLAVAVTQTSDAPDGTVIGEDLRGYTLGERVLRHAEVVVARATSNGQRATSDEQRATSNE